MNNELDGTEISLDKEKNRLFFKVSGFVNQERSDENFREIMKIANQLEENAGALIDLRGFTVAQKTESLNSDLSNLMLKVKYIANLMGSSPVGKLQVSRYSDEKKKIRT